MAKRLQLRRGTNAESVAFTGAIGEVVMDTTNKVLVVHDGITAGGFSVAARGDTAGTVTIVNRAGTTLATIPSTGLLNNTLTSTATDQALTAAQGKVLQDGKLGISSNAVSATKLVTARSINGVSFDGTANISVPALSTAISTAGTNLNTIQTAGFYYCSSNSLSVSFVNCPTVKAFSLLVIQSAGCIQELTEFYTSGTPKTWKRHYYNATWGSWYEVLTDLTPNITVTGTLTAGGLMTSGSISTGNIAATSSITSGATITGNTYAVSGGAATATLTGLGTGGGAAFSINPFSTGTTYGYVPFVAGAVQSSGGYRQNVSIGAYRPSSDWTNSGVYLATGTNDSSPTEAFTFCTGGNIMHTSGSCNLEGNASTATKLSTATGTAPSYSARAWVNFNGQGTYLS